MTESTGSTRPAARRGGARNIVVALVLCAAASFVGSRLAPPSLVAVVWLGGGLCLIAALAVAVASIRKGRK